jgi:hypothetical protein
MVSKKIGNHLTDKFGVGRSQKRKGRNKIATKFGSYLLLPRAKVGISEALDFKN